MKQGRFVVLRSKSRLYRNGTKIAQSVFLSLFTMCSSYKECICGEIILDTLLYV